MELAFQQRIKTLIDDLKAVCAAYGLGNDGNEFKIITQVFLYQFLNDKFCYEVKKHYPEFASRDDWADLLTDEKLAELEFALGGDTAIFKPEHLIQNLSRHQNDADFAKQFDDTLSEIARLNHDVFAVKTEGGAKVVLFERISQYLVDSSKHNDFFKAIINKITPASFEPIFSQKFDFYATIFEYLIKDYNSNSGGKYAEYYTPHAVARIMAAILVPENQRGTLANVSCYDPSAGSGTLLMNIAHAIGEDKCAIYTQDISQKSSNLLRLNLILNNLVASIPNVIQGNTMLHPAHKSADGKLKTFDFIVSNPPFKLDFSDIRDELDTTQNKTRFFAGVPSIPNKKKEGMAIYQLFIQHILTSLNDTGKAAIVLPTGFITAQSGIDKKIREYLVENQLITGVVSMPSNIFATNGTNVSIVFVDKEKVGQNQVVLIDASNLGEKIKDGKNQKTILSADEEQRIIDVFNGKLAEDDFSVVVSYDEIQAKNHSLSAGQYFDVKIDYQAITEDEFNQQMAAFKADLKGLFRESAELEKEILAELGKLGVG